MTVKDNARHLLVLLNLDIIRNEENEEKYFTYGNFLPDVEYRLYHKGSYQLVMHKITNMNVYRVRVNNTLIYLFKTWADIEKWAAAEIKTREAARIQEETQAKESADTRANAEDKMIFVIRTKRGVFVVSTEELDTHHTTESFITLYITNKRRFS